MNDFTLSVDGATTLVNAPCTRQSSPGVFLVSQYSPIGEVIDALVLVWAASDAEEWKNRIIKIPQS